MQKESQRKIYRNSFAGVFILFPCRAIYVTLESLVSINWPLWRPGMTRQVNLVRHTPELRIYVIQSSFFIAHNNGNSYLSSNLTFLPTQSGCRLDNDHKQGNQL